MPFCFMPRSMQRIPLGKIMATSLILITHTTRDKANFLINKYVFQAIGLFINVFVYRFLFQDLFPTFEHHISYDEFMTRLLFIFINKW